MECSEIQYLTLDDRANAQLDRECSEILVQTTEEVSVLILTEAPMTI